MCDNEKSKMCTRYFNFLDRQYGGCLSHEPTILAPMHDPLHLQQHCQREGVGGGGGLKGSKIFLSVLRFLSEIVGW